MTRATLTLCSFASLLAVIGGCKHVSGDDSSVKVTNGVETTGFPWVVELDDPDAGLLCTGTFVSDTTLLTAAHCINDTPAGGMQYNGIKAIKAFHVGDTGHTAALKATDLAVMVFAPNTAPAKIGISLTDPAANATVTLVGYGQNDVGSPGSIGVKRTGTNVVVGTAGGFIHLKGVPKAQDGVAPGAQVASSSGDSGGPLFANDLLVGIDTGGGVHADNLKHSYFVSLGSVPSCSLLKTAIAAGADIPTLPTSCGPPPAPPPSPAAGSDDPPAPNPYGPAPADP